MPARIINSLVNGPGFYLSGLIPLIPAALNKRLSHDADRLLGIAVFWFLIGLSIDRRGARQTLDRRHAIRAGVLFTFASLVCGVFGVAGVVDTFRWNYVVWKVVAQYPFSSSDTIYLGFLAWLLVFSAYFARKAFIAARTSLTTTA